MFPDKPDTNQNGPSATPSQNNKINNGEKAEGQPEIKHLREDGRINLPTDIAKKVAQIICKEIEESLRMNKAKYDLTKRCENQYAQITKYSSVGQVPDFPWYGAADYFVPMTEWIIDAVHARVVESLFAQEPYMQAVGETSEDIGKQENVTDFVDIVLREKVRLRENVEFFFKQMIKIPMAVCKYVWENEFDPIIQKEKAQSFTNQETGDIQYVLPDDPASDLQARSAELMANGYQESGMADVWVRQDKEIVNGLVLRTLKFEDYVWAPNAKKDHRLYWEGDRFWLTVSEMENNAKKDIYSKEVVEKIKNNSSQAKGSDIDQEVSKRSALHECFHWYGRLPMNKDCQVTFTDTEAVEQEVHAVVEYAENELLYLSLWEFERYPNPERVYIRGRYEETDEFIGRSLSEKIYMTQKYLNQFYNTLMNNAMIAMQKIFVKKKSMQDDATDNLTIYPGALWEEDTQGDIRVLDVGDIKQVSWELEENLMGFAERISNISMYQTGTARTSGGNKTKGEVDATISEGNIGLNRFIQNCHGVLQTICKWTTAYYYERMPQDMERRLRGEEGWIYPTPDNMGKFAEQGVDKYWNQDDIAGQYSYKWLGTALNSSKQWKLKVADDMVDIYLKQPMIAGSMIATWEILKQGLVARGEDWKKILPPREAVIKEMQLKAQKTKEEAQKPPAGPSHDGDAGGDSTPKGPSQSISFKDLPAQGKVQMARHAGIVLNPQDFILHDIQQKLLANAGKAPAGDGGRILGAQKKGDQ